MVILIDENPDDSDHNTGNDISPEMLAALFSHLQNLKHTTFTDIDFSNPPDLNSSSTGNI